MDFREVTDRLKVLGVGAQDVADALGLAVQTVRVMRMDPESPHHRTPPAGWRQALAELARSRAGALNSFADELDPG